VYGSQPKIIASDYFITWYFVQRKFTTWVCYANSLKIKYTHFLLKWIFYPITSTLWCIEISLTNTQNAIFNFTNTAPNNSFIGYQLRVEISIISFVGNYGRYHDQFKWYPIRKFSESF
jgi:hypothetical protein